MILLRREPVGPHLPGAVWDREIVAPEASPMSRYHAWTLGQLARVSAQQDARVRYELRPVA